MSKTKNEKQKAREGEAPDQKVPMGAVGRRPTGRTGQRQLRPGSLRPSRRRADGAWEMKRKEYEQEMRRCTASSSPCRSG